MWTFQRPTVACISRQLSCFYCSSEVTKVIAARYQQKKLYGAVVNKDKYNEIIVDVEDTSVTYKKYTTVNEDTSSEYHWLIQNHEQSKNIKVFKSSELDRVHNIREKSVTKLSNESLSKKSKTPKASDEKDSLSPASKQSVILSAKNLLNEFIISNRGKTINDIESLFNDTSLRAITKHAMVGDKSSERQLNEILFDKRLPSISKVLQATMSESARNALERWKMAKIAELGADGYNRYQQETFELGTKFHLSIENFLNLGEEPSKDSLVSNLWQSLGPQLKELELDPVLIEKPIIHPELKYKGIVDNVSYVNNELCALEWKTSEKTKSTLFSTYDAPVQLCAYIGAINADPRYDIKLQTGYVVIAYKNGNTAHIFRLSESDIRKYWSMWLSRLQEYWIRYRDGTLPDPI